MEAQIEFVNITVHRLTVGDKRNRDRVWRLLHPVFGSKDAEADLWNFLTLWSTTDTITGVDMFLPNADDLFDVWEQAWNKYNALDYELVQQWIQESNKVNTSPNDRRYLPPDQLNDDEKKIGVTSAAHTAVQ